MHREPIVGVICSRGPSISLPHRFAGENTDSKCWRNRSGELLDNIAGDLEQRSRRQNFGYSELSYPRGESGDGHMRIVAIGQKYPLRWNSVYKSNQCFQRTRLIAKVRRLVAPGTQASDPLNLGLIPKHDSFDQMVIGRVLPL